MTNLVLLFVVLSAGRQFHALSLISCWSSFIFFDTVSRSASQIQNSRLKPGTRGIPLGRRPSRTSLPFPVISTGDASMSTPITLRLCIVTFDLVGVVSLHSCIIGGDSGKNEAPTFCRKQLSHAWELLSLLFVTRKLTMAPALVG